MGSKQKNLFFYSIFAHRVSKRKLSEIVKHISFCLYALIDIDLLTLHVLERYWLISPSRIDPFSYCKAVIFKTRCNQKVAYSP